MFDFDKIKKPQDNKGILQAQRKKRLQLSIINEDLIVENITKDSPRKMAFKKIKTKNRIVQDIFDRSDLSMTQSPPLDSKK